MLFESVNLFLLTSVRLLCVLNNLNFPSKLILLCASIIFLISTWLLVTGIEIGYTKFIFNKIDEKSVKISDLFNYFDILPRYIYYA